MFSGGSFYGRIYIDGFVVGVEVVRLTRDGIEERVDISPSLVTVELSDIGASVVVVVSFPIVHLSRLLPRDVPTRRTGTPSLSRLVVLDSSAVARTLFRHEFRYVFVGCHRCTAARNLDE